MGRKRRAAENELLYRELNERIRDVNEQFGLDGDRLELVCECSRLGCSERIVLTPAEYANVRAHSARFALVPGHEDPQLERVVERNDRFAVVEKLAD